MELILIITIIISLYKIPTSSYEAFGQKLNDPFGFKEETRIKVKCAMANLDHRKKMLDQSNDEADVRFKEEHIEYLKHAKTLKESNVVNCMNAKNIAEIKALNKSIIKEEIKLFGLMERNMDNRAKRWIAE